VRGTDGITVVEMAGLGRSESAKVPEELGELAGILYDQTPAESTEDTTPHPTPEPQEAPSEGAEK
jgi:cytochrome c biogenesis protein